MTHPLWIGVVDRALPAACRPHALRTRVDNKYLVSWRQLTCAAFAAFGLYGLSGAADIRRLPLLRAGLVSIAVIYVCRATVYGGIAAVRDGDTVQIVFAAIALLIGLCYANGAFVQRHPTTAAPRAAAL